jgi:hypothetical protein
MNFNIKRPRVNIGLPKKVEKPHSTEPENLKYEAVSKSTVSLNTGAVLPKKAILDPLWTNDIIKGSRECKNYEDAVSLPVMKLPINPKLVFMIIIGVILFVAIALPVLNQQGLLDNLGGGIGDKLQGGFERIVPKLPGVND